MIRMSAVTIAAMSVLLFAQTNGAYADKMIHIDDQVNLQTDENQEVIVELSEKPKQVTLKDNDFTALTEDADEEKASFLTYIKDHDISFDYIETFAEVFNGAALKLSGNDLSKLLDFPGVEGVYHNQQYTLDTEMSTNSDETEVTEHEQLTAIHDTGLTGEGITVGVLDTGIDYHHPYLEDAYQHGMNFVGEESDSVLEGGEGFKSTHGTNVSGVISGRNSSDGSEVVGIAPDAKLNMYRVLDENRSGSTMQILLGIEEAVKDGVDIMNLSLGRNDNQEDTPLTRAINHAVIGGTPVIVSAGNYGGEPLSMADPGTAQGALTIGAADTTADESYSIPAFSSRGPVAETYRMKPEVVAPGVEVFSTASLQEGDDYADAFGKFSGTSLAAPYVTGLTALMLEDDPSLSPEKIRKRVMNSADPQAEYSVNDAGAGRVQADELFNTEMIAGFSETYEIEDDPVDYQYGGWNLGLQQLPDNRVKKEPLTITNDSSSPAEFDLEYNVFDREGITLSGPKEITVEAHAETEVPVTVRRTSSASEGEVSDYIRLNEQTGGQDMYLPAGAELAEAEEPAYDFNLSPNYFNGEMNSIEYAVTADLEIEEITTEITRINEEDLLGAFSLSSDESEWDLTYTNPEGDTAELEDGFFDLAVQLHVGDGYFKETETIVYNREAPQLDITENEIDGNEIDGNELAGEVTSPLWNYSEWDDTPVEATFELSQAGEVYHTEDADFSETGEFRIQAEDMPSGETSVSVTGTDITGNEFDESAQVFSEDGSPSVNDEKAEKAQQDLYSLGFLPEEKKTGEWDNTTAEAIEDMQTYFELTVTGEYDEETRDFLDEQMNTIYQDWHVDPEIQEMKLKLTGLGVGNFPDDPSENYGSVTAAVVKEFQAKYGLIENGIIDERTMEQIEQAWEQSLKDGDDKNEVHEMKQQLSATGFGNFPDSPSNRYGPVTTGVVKEFQAHEGLHVSGTANPQTRERLQDLSAVLLEDGSDSEEVRQMKKTLTEAGYGNFPDYPSTRYGSVTAGVVSSYQEDQGFAVNGQFNQKMADRLTELTAIKYQDGDDQEAIVSMKQMLTKLGFGNFPDNPSTRYGPVTEGVVSEFQSYYGFTESGSLNERAFDFLQTNAETELQDGNESAEIVDIKKQLTEHGFGNFPDSPSNVYGPVTEGVVKDFQRDAGLNVTGIVDEKTYEELYN